MSSLAGIGIVILIVGMIITLLLVISHLITQAKAGSYLFSKAKDAAYECGLEGTLPKSSRISSGYYLTAILFVLFDIEIIFLYPWAVAYRKFIDLNEGTPYFIAFIIFLALFVVGLFWEIRVKALDWK